MEIPQVFCKYDKEIIRLWASDPKFQEVWNHYRDVSDMIRALDTDSSTEIELKRLRASLEAEIFEALG